jgi:hypothetical protein
LMPALVHLVRVEPLTDDRPDALHGTSPGILDVTAITDVGRCAKTTDE